MQSNHADCHYVVTNTPTFCSAIVDLSRSRSVHAVEHNPCCPDPTVLSASECKAVHYGLCSPLLKLPSFTIPPGTSSTTSSPNSPKGNESPKLLQSSSGQSSHFPQNLPETSSIVATSQSTPSQVSKVDLEIFDPVELLAVDLEGKLEALVSTFVAQDKVRLAARRKGETSRNANADNGIQSSSTDSDDFKSGSYTKDRQDATIKTSKGDQITSFFENIASFQDGKSPFQSPASKITTFSPLKPSPEYQQSGVKAQISLFATREKEISVSPVNTLERRTKGKAQSTSDMSPSFKPGPLSLDELQELLKSTSEPVPDSIQTTIYQSSKLSNDMDVLSYRSSPSPPSQQEMYMLSSPKPIQVQQGCEPSYPSLVYQNESVLKSHNPSQAQVFANVHHDACNKSQEFVQSPVDYAKTRFQIVQRANKYEEVKPKPRNGQLVTEAKYKWEHLPQYQQHPHHWSSDTLVVNGDSKKGLSLDGLLDIPSPSIPHPKLTNVQRQHIKERSLSPTDRHSHVPIRPFLTKGSVAERVLLFECCPDRALERSTNVPKNKSLLINTWRGSGSDVHNKTQNIKDKENIEPASPRSSSLKRFASKSCPSAKRIPRFHYPEGKPSSPAEVEAHLQRVASVFGGLNEQKATREEFGIITKACGLPLYWKLPLFLAARGEKRTSLSCDAFLEFWRRVVNSFHDEPSQFVYIMSRGKRNYIIQEDFVPFMQDVIDSHPGLTFLKEATEFHSRYIHTVIARIYYEVNRSWSGKITVPELRKSNFLQVLSNLEEEDDINQITEYFSYEHFYVIYCKFWELDKDHDLYIDQNDLRQHNGGALSTRIIQRIFSGAVTRGSSKKEGKMTYTDFVWFLLSEEDKRCPRSIEYWFRCMDLDGDGFLSMYELEYFYEEQLQRLHALGFETLPFTDLLCQMLDIITPRVEGKISLSDLKKCKMTPIFFDTFFNLEKYLDHEQRDPFSSQREHDGDGLELSDWDRYAAEEYELLVAEEGAVEQHDELGYRHYNTDALSQNLENMCHMNRNIEENDYAETDVDYHY